MCTTINVLSKNKKNIIFFHLKINIFAAMKYCCILHGRVCVMFKCNFKTLHTVTQTGCYKDLQRNPVANTTCYLEQTTEVKDCH